MKSIIECLQARKRTIKKYLSDKSFDLVLYPTPPITFANVVAFCKRKYGCKSYLMLKDIFPQNAIDLGLMKKSGIIYKYFKIIEKKLYKNSDYIGCMSEANMKYIKKHQPWIDHNKIELFPNTVDSSKFKRGKTVGLSKTELGVPENTTLFLFGGNLSKPQGIDFLLGCLYELREYSEAYFLIIGSGTEFEKIHSFITENNLKNVKLLKEVERDRYEMIVNICDVGLILLDYRFTIPNYPARTLSYMIQSLPLLAATDVNTDIKELIEEQAKCGYWCASNNVTDFVTMVKLLCLDAEKRVTMGLNGRKYFEEHFDVSVSVSILEKHFQVR